MTATTENPETAEPVTVKELLGFESGVWCGVTRDSCHYFDFDKWTVIRIPGRSALPMLGDPIRPLREIEKWKVGERGAWTMHTDGWDAEIDYYWHISSVISEIRQVATATSVAESDAEGAA